MGENSSGEQQPASGSAFSDPLLLYLIDFHLRKMFVLISTKLPLALADYSDTYYAGKRWRFHFYSNCSQSDLLFKQ